MPRMRGDDPASGWIVSGGTAHERKLAAIMQRRQSKRCVGNPVESLVYREERYESTGIKASKGLDTTARGWKW